MRLGNTKLRSGRIEPLSDYHEVVLHGSGVDGAVVAVYPSHLEGAGEGLPWKDGAREEKAGVRGDGVVEMTVGVVAPLNALTRRDGYVLRREEEVFYRYHRVGCDCLIRADDRGTGERCRGGACRTARR